jgi:hypothetical protein
MAKPGINCGYADWYGRLSVENDDGFILQMNSANISPRGNPTRGGIAQVVDDGTVLADHGRYLYSRLRGNRPNGIKIALAMTTNPKQSA